MNILKTKLLIYADISLLYLGRALIAIIPFASVPLLIRSLGSAQWTKLAVWQSGGLILSTFIELSWSSSGFSRILGKNIRMVARQAIRQKILVFIFANLVLFTLIGVFGHKFPNILTTIVIIYSSSIGLSNSWIWIGTKKNHKFLFYEATPKFIFGIMLLPFLSSRNSIIFYFLLQGIINFTVSILPLLTLPKLNVEHEIYQFKNEISYGAARMVQSIYFAAFLPIGNFIHLLNLTNFAIIERIYRFTMSIAAPASQYFSAQIVRGNMRIKRILKLAAFISIFTIAVLLAIGGTPISALLFKQKIHLDGVFVSFMLLSVAVTFNRLFVVMFISKKKIQSHLSLLLTLCSLIFAVSLYPFQRLFPSMGIVISAVLAELFFFMGGLFINRRFTD